MTKTDYSDLILKIIIFLLAVLVIYWAMQLIFGGSPELSEFNLALIVLIIGILFQNYREIGEIKTEVKYISLNVKESFDKIKEDVSSIKKSLKI
ncbi:MAG: hypothetical protein AABX28_01115 [Nanoarchaeota archaeon]